MARARIITRFPEQSHDLAENLRSRGFEVQTESPGKISPQPADLEITIEECDAEEALQRATSVQDACAFVMPGAITGGVQPITAIPFIPQMNIEKSETVGSEARAAEIENLPRHSFGMEAPCAEVAEFGATAIGDLESEPSVNEDARAMIFEPERATAEPQPIFLEEQPENQQPEMVSASASETVFPQTEADSRPPEPELISAESQMGEAAVSAAGEIPDALRDAEPVFAESRDVQEAQLSQLRTEDLQPTPAVEEPQAPLHAANDLKTQTQSVRMEDAGSHAFPSEEVVALSTHRPSSEQSPGPGSPESVELAAESIAQVSIPSSGSELLSGKEVAAQNSKREKEPSSKSRPVSDWPIWQPISAEEKAREIMGPAEQQPIYDARTSAPFALPLQRQGVPRSTMRRVRNSRLLHHPIFTNEKMFWRTATFVGVIAIGLLLGMSAHRLSPLPASLQQRSVDLQPSETKPAAIVPAELKPVTRQYRVGSRATRVPKLPAELTPPLTASKVNLASSRQPVMRSASDSTENDTDIAEDTVVRYGSRSGSSAVAPSQQKPSVKRT